MTKEKKESYRLTTNVVPGKHSMALRVGVFGGYTTVLVGC